MSMPDSQKQMHNKLVKIPGKDSGVSAISGGWAVAATVFDKPESGSYMAVPEDGALN